ncbi:MAG: phosphate/phosphite/phosphonate ABC transporter substrate-binding protein [Pseudobdellovibrionaceae bacterium]
MRGEKGSRENPILFSMVPAKDTRTLMLHGEEFSKWMEKETGLHFQVTVPTSYIAVVEAFGSKRVDIAYLNTTSYFLAQEKYQVEAEFITLNRDGSNHYKGQFIVRADSKIKKLEDIKGKKIAYVDPTSASGYILPAFMLKQKAIKPAQEVFAGKHDSVVSMVYQKQVDVGATFYSIPEDGEIRDARSLVRTQYPDVEEKIKVLAYTPSLMNDAVVFRSDLDEALKEKLIKAIEKWIQTPEGKVTLKALSNGSNLRRVKESEYSESRKIIKEMARSLGQK